MQDEEYLIQHRIPHLVDELLLDLVKARPPDVVGFFIDWLTAKQARRFFVAAHWKCSGSAMVTDLCEELNKGERGAEKRVEVIVACPAQLLGHARRLLRDDWAVGVPHGWTTPEGTFATELSPELMAEAGVRWALVGLAERRYPPAALKLLGSAEESDEVVAAKAAAALHAGLSVVFCCGESPEAQAGPFETTATLERQCAALGARLAVGDWGRVVLAYEAAAPTAVVEVQAVHRRLRSWLEATVGAPVAAATRIVYGGPDVDHAYEELAQQPDVDGFLVGDGCDGTAFLRLVAAHRLKSSAPS